MQIQSSFLACVIVCSLSVFADEPKWIAQACRVPDSLPATKRPLRSLATSLEGRPIASRAEWDAERSRLIAAWLEFLGPMPERPRSADYRVLRRDDCEFGSRELIEYENEPNERVQAYLLRPKPAENEKLRAGIIALHPTTNLTIEAIAGVQGAESEHTGVALVRAGFTVICPQCFLWQEAKSIPEAAKRHAERHPQAKGMAKMLYDAQRALDILAEVKGVDPQRLGAFGHSLGAKETLYLTAFDARIRAAVASEGGIALESTNWDAPWYLGPDARKPDFPRDHHELLALVVPRPFLVIAGEKGSGAADGLRSWPYLAAAGEAAKWYEHPARLGLRNHGLGHPLPAEELAKGIAWLEFALEENMGPK